MFFMTASVYARLSCSKVYGFEIEPIVLVFVFLRFPKLEKPKLLLIQTKICEEIFSSL